MLGGITRTLEENFDEDFISFKEDDNTKINSNELSLYDIMIQEEEDLKYAQEYQDSILLEQKQKKWGNYFSSEEKINYARTNEINNARKNKWKLCKGFTREGKVCTTRLKDTTRNFCTIAHFNNFNDKCLSTIKNLVNYVLLKYISEKHIRRKIYKILLSENFGITM